MAKLSDFMVSRVRSKILKILLATPHEMYYVRELTRQTKEEINAVRRELARLLDKGMVKSETRGNRLYYQFRDNYLFFPELISIVAKTTGLGKVILKNRAKIGFLKFAFLNTKFVRGVKKNPEEVDLILVGKIIMPQIGLIVKEYEEVHHVEVNYSCMTEDEYHYRRDRKDPFITNVLSQPRVMLFGDELQLVS